MRRLTFAVVPLVLAVASLVLTLGPAHPRAGAQAGTATAGPGFVGAWRLTVTEPGNPPLQALTTLAADGTLINSDPPVSPAGGGGPITVSSAGHGVWHETGPTTAALTFVELDTDAQGHFLGTATISAQITLGADGDSLLGSFRVTAADPNGKVLFQGAGTLRATRITVQPVGTPPVGTPAT